MFCLHSPAVAAPLPPSTVAAAATVHTESHSHPNPPPSSAGRKAAARAL